jgi:integrase
MKLPNLRRRGRAYYYDHGGNPRRWEALGTDEAVALRRYQRIVDAAKTTPGTVDQMVRECLEGLAGKRAKGTIENYRTWRGHLGEIFGAQRPEELTQADVLRYLNKCPRLTARGEIGLLSMSFAAWMEQGRLEFNPCFGVKSKAPRAKRTRLLSDAELDAIIKAAPERVAVAIEIAYATGLRIGDLITLRWADIAEGVETRKTGARLRFAASPALDILLARARALQARVGSLYVLCQAGGKPWTQGSLRPRWDKACTAAGVKDAHFHDIRAKSATDADREFGPQVAQRLLGHSNPRTTEVYLRERRAAVVVPMIRKRA